MLVPVVPEQGYGNSTVIYSICNSIYNIIYTYCK